MMGLRALFTPTMGCKPRSCLALNYRNDHCQKITLSKNYAMLMFTCGMKSQCQACEFLNLSMPYTIDYRTMLMCLEVCKSSLYVILQLKPVRSLLYHGKSMYDSELFDAVFPLRIELQKLSSGSRHRKFTYERLLISCGTESVTKKQRNTGSL